MAQPNGAGSWKFTPFIIVLLLGISRVSFQNVAGNSELSSQMVRLWLLNGVSTSEATPVTNSTGPTSSKNHWITTTTEKAVEPPHDVTLDLDSPEDERDFTANCAIKFHLPTQNNYSKYRLGIHLKTCNYDDDEFITIDTGSGLVKWKCLQHSNTYDSRHKGDQHVSVQHFLDNVTEVLITTNFTSTSHKSRSKGTIVVNLYRDYDSPDSCPRGFFDCYQPLCPDCCTHKKADTSRCIPMTLRCDGSPNCGMSKNADETNEICHPESTCRCQTLCLTWNYVLTSLAIAILFIITPTAVVFALFHRRHVALERARLIRIAAERTTGFYRESSATDLPPTYDEVYDIKEPPPCFCQAVATDVGVGALDLQRCQESVGASERDGPQNESSGCAVGSQNLGFQCSCNNVSRENVALEPPPNYIDIRSSDSINNGNDNSYNSSAANCNREVDV